MSGNPNPIDDVFINGVSPDKSAVRNFHKIYAALVLSNADEIGDTDLSQQQIVILQSNGRAYKKDTGDTTSPDDGETLIRDANGIAFSLVVIDGIDGSNGATWISGSGAPTTSPDFGSNGDLYLNETNGDVYKKVAGVWGSPIINIKGADGSGAVSSVNTKTGDVLVEDIIHSASSKATPIDTDEFGLADSATSPSWTLKKVTWANIKATLKTYFDTLYQPLASALTSWAAITRASGFDTFVTTPSSANLAALVTDEDGSGTVVFSGAIREKLTTGRTYYIRSDGSDSNNGLSNASGGAFETIQKAWDVLVTLDLNGFDITIKLGNTVTLTGNLAANVAPVGGNVIIEGDTSTPTNTIISKTSGDAIQINCSVNLTIQYLKVQTTTSGYGIAARHRAAKITLGNGMNYGACASGHLLARPGYIRIPNPSGYTIAGSAPSHFEAAGGGVVEVVTLSATLSGTPAFSFAFAVATILGIIDAFGFTFSGSATGSRYSIQTGSAINTYGGGASYFPGNSVGSGGTTTGSGFYA